MKHLASIALITSICAAVCAQSVEVRQGIFTDPRDGTSYKTIDVDGQVWMAENLNFETEEGSWAYEDEDVNAKKYGRLYDGKTAKTACPDGWHLPTHDEWIILEINAGMDEDSRFAVGWRGDDWGNKFKSESGWDEDGNGSDALGFCALPGGLRFSDGFYKGAGYLANFWTADGDAGMYVRYLYATKSALFVESYFPDFAMSVRCLKGPPPPEKKVDGWDGEPL